MDLLAPIIVVSIASLLIGALLQYIRDAIHYDHEKNRDR